MVAVATVGLLVGLAPVSLIPISGTALAAKPIAPAVAFQPPTAVVAGGFHTCALLADSSIKCLGQDDHGQLGDGTTTNSSAPVAVTGISNAIGLALGDTHSCALLADGSVKCWGSNSHGQLGDGTATDRSYAGGRIGNHERTCRSAPAVTIPARFWPGPRLLPAMQRVDRSNAGVRTPTVSSVTGRRRIAATPVRCQRDHEPRVIPPGDAHECAIDHGRRPDPVLGLESSGQLGNGTTTDSSNPVIVGVFGVFTPVAAGAEQPAHAGGPRRVRCWGSNPMASSATGPSPTAFFRSTSSSFGRQQPTALEAGGNDSCVLLTVAWCWGSNQDGELAIGEGRRFDSSTPTDVGGGRCWPGFARAWSGRPAAVRSVAFGPLRVSGGRAAGPALDPRPVTIRRAALNPSVASPQVTAITVGVFHMCALLDDSTVRCWGYDGSDQLGDGSNGDRHSPVGVYGLTTAAALSLGGYHSCALVTGAHVECWGNNDDGEIGNVTQADMATPVTVPGISTATTVSTSNYHTCARLSNATVRCWGFGALRRARQRQVQQQPHAGRRLRDQHRDLDRGRGPAHLRPPVQQHGPLLGSGLHRAARQRQDDRYEHAGHGQRDHDRDGGQLRIRLLLRPALEQDGSLLGSQRERGAGEWLDERQLSAGHRCGDLDRGGNQHG